MKTKTINFLMKKKMNEWLNSIDNPVVAKLAKRDLIVTGGSITSMLLNETVNDFDVYFKTKETIKVVSQYYCDKFNEKNKNRDNKVNRKLHAWVLDGEDVEKWKQGKITLSSFAYDYEDMDYNVCEEYRKSGQSTSPKDFTDPEIKKTIRKLNAVSSMLLNTPPDRVKIMVNSDGIAEDSDFIADEVEYNINEYLDRLSDGDEISEEELETKERYKPVFLSTNAITLSNKIQLIIRFFGGPEEIHNNYDFIHATNYWTYDEGLITNKRALEAILNKELHYFGSKYPIASMIRTRKFIKRGWQINAGQFVKIAWQISELDLTDIDVLEDQLVGVDSIYFLRFVELLKSRKASDKDFTLSRDYVTSVIDKIFG